MKLVCYAYKNQKSELQAPFLDYLEKYAIRKRDTEKSRGLKLKHLANVESHLNYLLDHGGSYDLPPIVQKYRGKNFGILKIKESSKLIRLAFFTKKGNQIILLSAIDKPKLYEKGRKQKVNKMIEKFLDEAECYMKNYFKNNLSLPLIF